MALELESKQRVPDGHAAERILADPAIRACLQEEWRVREQFSAYYDTPGHDLHRLQWELRLRREGADSEAALKTPRDGGGPHGLTARNEWQCQTESIREAVPRLVRLGAPEKLLELTRDKELPERCHITCTRTSGFLELPGSTVAELALDSGLLLADGKQEPFIELEIELKFGDPAVLTALTERLALEYGLTPELAGKYERALRLIRSRRRVST